MTDPTDRLESTYISGEPRKIDVDHHKAGERDTSLYYDESDTGSVEILTGVSKVEAAQAVWWVYLSTICLHNAQVTFRGPKSQWFLFIGSVGFPL